MENSIEDSCNNNTLEGRLSCVSSLINNTKLEQWIHASSTCSDAIELVCEALGNGSDECLENTRDYFKCVLTNHFNNCSSMTCFGAVEETKDSVNDSFFATSWGKLIFIFLGVVVLMFLDFCCERRCFLRCFREKRTYDDDQDHNH